jgi:hypothetical protein
MDLRLWKQREDRYARWEKEVIMNFEKLKKNRSEKNGKKNLQKFISKLQEINNSIKSIKIY